MQKLVCLLSLFLICLIGCKKEDPRGEIPPLTNEAKNVFGCYVNGELWLPDYEGQFPRDRAVRGDHYHGEFRLAFNGFYPENPGIQSIAVEMRGGVFTTGRYNFDGDLWLAGFIDYDRGCSSRVTDTLSGWIEITYLDTVANIASGRLEFTASDSDCGTYVISDGVFDVRI